MLAKCALLIAALVPTLLGATSPTPSHQADCEASLPALQLRPCAWKAFPVRLRPRIPPLVFFRSGRSVKTRTDGLGRYRVGLAPGWWKVSTATVPRIGSGIEPHALRVFAARFRVVNLEIDTGIR